MPPLPSKKDYDEIVKRLEGGADRADAEGAGAARRRRLAALGERRHPGTALREDGGAQGASRIPKRSPSRCATLQQQWRQAADVPRAQGEALWQRFKTAHDEAWTRCEAHFAAQAEARGENLAKKIALCERAEALAESTNWIQTADEIKRLQAEWKTIGAGQPRPGESDLGALPRAPAIASSPAATPISPSARRSGPRTSRRRKRCARRPRRSRDSTDWDAAAAEIKRLQAEWKTIGPVKKSRSEAIWQRFRGAVRSVLRALRAAPRHRARRTRRRARGDLRGARSAGGSSRQPSSVEPSRRRRRSRRRRNRRSRSLEPPADLMATVRALRGRWQQELAARGVDRDRALALDERFADGVRRASSRAGRRCSAAPISIPTPTASGWKRSSPRIEDAREVARRAGVRRRRRRAVADRRGWPRC